jgi:quercetin dioxygenase-like cupin family protein
MASCRPLVLAALVAVGLLIGAHGTPGYAQSTSPMTGTPSTDPLAGITSETLGSGVPRATPGQTFELARVTFAPGATIPLHTNPGAQLVSVLSGELTLMATQAGGQLIRPEAPSGTPAPPEAVDPGSSIVLHPGEGFFFPQGTVHLLHNAGTEPTVIMVATLFAADQPDLVWTNEQGTPTP